MRLTPFHPRGVPALVATAGLALTIIVNPSAAQAASTFVAGTVTALPTDGNIASGTGSQALAVSRTGSTGYYVTPDGGLRVLTLTPGGGAAVRAQERNIPGDGIVLSANGQTAYVTNTDSDSVEVADLTTPTPTLLGSVSLGSLTPTSIAASSDGHYLAIGTEIGFLPTGVDLLSLSGSRIPKAIPGVGRLIPKGGSVGGFSQDSKYLLVGNSSGSVSEFTLPSRKLVATISLGTATPWQIVSAPDSHYAYVYTDGNGAVEKLDLIGHRRAATSPATNATGASLSVSPDGKYIYQTSGSLGGTLWVLSAATMRTVAVLDSSNLTYITAVATSTAGATRGTFYAVSSDLGYDTPPLLSAFTQTQVAATPTSLKLKISANPANGIVRVGHRLAISAAVSGAVHPYHYTWYHNGHAVAGQHSSTLVISRTSTTSGGNYSVRVSDSSGWALSVVKSFRIVR